MFTDIRLQQFRSYADESFELSDGVNVIVGPNASGKTNLLEAILVVARGDSYRAKDSELLQSGSLWSRLESHTRMGQRVVKLEKQPSDTTKKTVEVDGQMYQRLNLQKKIPIVIFEPNHLLLLTGTPELRRNFLDDLIEQTVPGYGTTRRHYKRVLAQRNSLLKQGQEVARNQIFVWNLRLSELGGKIAHERLKLLTEINESASEIYQNLSRAKNTIELVYDSVCTQDQYETSLLRRLEANIERDCLIGYTTSGPHRDDVRVLLNHWRAENTASRGETRTLVLMLKIIELRVLEKARGVRPLLLLDDVFSELDGVRRHALTTHMQAYQTFITTTDADVVVKHFVQLCNVISLGV